MIITAQYQIYVGTKQKELGVNSTQLLTNMVPVSAVITLFLTPFLDRTGIFFEEEHSLVNYEFTMVRCHPSGWFSCLKVFSILIVLIGGLCLQPAVAAVIGSAVLAVFVNMSIFLLISATSPVTYNVVGHFKTVLILSFRSVAR
jgi:solute carrier family 35, member E3